MKRIKIFYDLETTGINHKQNSIHQLAGLIEIDGEIVEEFDIRARPHPKAKVSEKALEVSGTTMEQLESYQSQKEAHFEFTAMLRSYVNRFDKRDKAFLVGYNNRHFDDFFLRTLFEINGDSYFGAYFWVPTFDTMILAGQFLEYCRPKMKDFKLKTVAEYLGLVEKDSDKWHDALFDVKVTREIYKTVTKPLHVGGLI